MHVRQASRNIAWNYFIRGFTKKNNLASGENWSLLLHQNFLLYHQVRYIHTVSASFDGFWNKPFNYLEATQRQICASPRNVEHKWTGEYQERQLCGYLLATIMWMHSMFDMPAYCL